MKHSKCMETRNGDYALRGIKELGSRLSPTVPLCGQKRGKNGANVLGREKELWFRTKVRAAGGVDWRRPSGRCPRRRRPLRDYTSAPSATAAPATGQTPTGAKTNIEPRE